MGTGGSVTYYDLKLIPSGKRTSGEGENLDDLVLDDKFLHTT